MGRFHQHFTLAFFIQKCFAQLFSSYILAFYFVWHKNIGKNVVRKMLMKLTPGVNVISILQAAFMLIGPKSAKQHCWLDCLFKNLGSARIKAKCKSVGEIESWCQFHQLSTYSFYAHRSQKRKKDWQLDCRFYTSGICACKSCT